MSKLFMLLTTYYILFSDPVLKLLLQPTEQSSF